MLAKDIMTKDVITLNPEMDLKEAAIIFLNNNISGAPVIDVNKRLVGVLTEGDLVRQQKPIQKPIFMVLLDGSFPINYRKIQDDIDAIVAQKVEELMIKKVITAHEYADISELANLILEKGINRIPIMNDEEQLLGIVTRQDIIRAMYVRE